MEILVVNVILVWLVIKIVTPLQDVIQFKLFVKQVASQQEDSVLISLLMVMLYF
jgi:hypothetical protein